jgi:hypothetical protein
MVMMDERDWKDDGREYEEPPESSPQQGKQARKQAEACWSIDWAGVKESEFEELREEGEAREEECCWREEVGEV